MSLNILTYSCASPVRGKETESNIRGLPETTGTPSGRLDTDSKTISEDDVYLPSAALDRGGGISVKKILAPSYLPRA